MSLSWQHLSILLGQAVPYAGTCLFVGIGYLGVRRRRVHHSHARKQYRATVANDMTEPHSLHPEVDPLRCAGCGACVRACPEGEILKMIDHRAVLVQPTKCVGHGECEQACPFDAITLVFGTKTRGKELPRISSNYETNVPGLYIAGELGGMGLIRNAVKQGRLAAGHALKTAPKNLRADCDLLIVGAGAAGLSAALTAVAANRPYLCIEQNSVGGTIYNFPRQKIVMSQPADVPIVGTMKFPRDKVSKETLLAYWTWVRHRTGLKVREGCKFLNLSQDAQGIFHVETSLGPVTAKKVVLAMGVRGSPRKLDLPNEDSAKVTYNLLDPRQYQRKHIAVVGSGNAGVEAAQMLANPAYKNRVTLLVRSGQLGRCNRENQNAIMALQQKGLVHIGFNTVVREIHPHHLIVEKDGGHHELPNDYLFIFAGAEMPFKFLASLGVKTEKKFGEPLKKA